MKTNRLAKPFIAAAALVAAASLPAAASAQAGITPGMQVVDQAGNSVGTVKSVSGGNLVVKTDRHEVQLPATSFTPNEGKLLFGMSRDQLNAATDQALAAANATITVGADVRGSGGEVAGTIDAMDTETVTLKLTSGELVRLPRNAVAGTPNGPVLGVSAEELKAMAQQATAAPEANPAQ